MALQDVDMTAPGKLMLLGLVIVGCFVVIIVSMIQGNPETALVVGIVGILNLAVGYLIGNGTGARKGVPTVAPFAPKTDS